MKVWKPNIFVFVNVKNLKVKEYKRSKKKRYTFEARITLNDAKILLKCRYLTDKKEISEGDYVRIEATLRKLKKCPSKEEYDYCYYARIINLIKYKQGEQND